MFVLAPWRGSRTWRSLAYLGLGGVFGVVASIVVVTLGLARARVDTEHRRALVLGWMFFGVAALFGRVERSRAAADTTDAYQVSVHSGNGSTSTEVRTDPTSKRHITATSDNGNVTIRYGPG